MSQTEGMAGRPPSSCVNTSAYLVDVLLYESLARSVLEYNSLHWAPVGLGDIEELKNVSEKAFKIPKSCRRECSSERLSQIASCLVRV